MPHRRRFFVMIALLLMFTAAGGVSARAIYESELCTIEADETIEGNAFVLCGELTVEGRVTGHILGAARLARISGSVDGSVYLVGGQLEIDGTIGKDVHFAGVTLDIHENAVLGNGGIISANFSGTISPSTTINGSVINTAYQLLAGGDITQEINFWGSALHIDGQIGGDVNATVGDSGSNGVSSQISTLLIPLEFLGFEISLVDPGLIVSETADLQGDLTYRAPSPGIIEGQTASAPDFISTAPAQLTEIGEDPQRGLSLYFGRVLREFITLGFIGVVGLLVMPKAMQSTLRPLQIRPLSTFGVGMLSFIMSFPIVLIVFLVSILIVVLLNVLPLDEVALFGAVVLGLANIGGAGLFYFTAIFIARVIVGLALGRLLLRLARRDDGTLRSLLISLGIGLFLLTMGGALPVIGWIVYALALFLGLGAILGAIQTRFQQVRATDPPPPPPGRYTAEFLAVSSVLPYYPEESLPYTPPNRPPMLDDTTRGRGMANLPEGFDINWLNDED